MKSETTEQRANGIGRRGFMRKVGVGVGTAAAVSGGALRLDHGPVQNSQAIAPAVVAGGVGASMAAGWALREFEVLGSDSPAEGLTGDSLISQTRQAAQARESNNRSTFIDNKNILDSIDHAAYADGKIAAIDALNDQLSESEVTDAAHDATIEYETTVVENLMNSWNESVEELGVFTDAIKEHSDVNTSDAFPDVEVSTDERDYSLVDDPISRADPYDHELPDGSTIEVKQYKVEWDSYSADGSSGGSGTRTIDVLNPQSHAFGLIYEDGDNPNYYLASWEWSELFDKIGNEFAEVRDGLSTWVNNIYEDIQSGDLDTAELLTPREQAELTAEDEGFAQAISDLQALNISTDLEREAEIFFPEPEATAYGQISYTGDTTLSTGTVDPDETDEDDEPIYPGSFYFTYDVSQGQGTWSAYEEGIDGGTLTFTAEPFEETIYTVETTAGETAEFHSDDLDSEDWTVDLSDQLDDQITNVEAVDYYADVDSTQFETIQLTDEFEIKGFTDSDGESYDESNFERSEPQTDDNYITEEEWQEQQERHEELIQKYEDAQGSGGILPDFDNIGDIPAEYIAAAAAVVGGAALFGNSG